MVGFFYKGVSLIYLIRNILGKRLGSFWKETNSGRAIWELKGVGDKR